MIEVLFSASVSIMVGVTLWALLPRGVVLTRSFPAVAPDGRVLLDTWRLRNESPLPVRIRSVAVSGVGTYDDTKGALRWLEVGTEDEDGLSATLHLDDEVTEIVVSATASPGGPLSSRPATRCRPTSLTTRPFEFVTGGQEHSARSSAGRFRSTAVPDEDGLHVAAAATGLFRPPRASFPMRRRLARPPE
jgi:hypothetical protein